MAEQPLCTICRENPRSSRGWCARCWKLYQRARRRGADTVVFLRKLRERFDLARKTVTKLTGKTTPMKKSA